MFLPTLCEHEPLSLDIHRQCDRVAIWNDAAYHQLTKQCRLPLHWPARETTSGADSDLEEILLPTVSKTDLKGIKSASSVVLRSNPCCLSNQEVSSNFLATTANDLQSKALRLEDRPQ